MHGTDMFGVGLQDLPIERLRLPQIAGLMVLNGQFEGLLLRQHKEVQSTFQSRYKLERDIVLPTLHNGLSLSAKQRSKNSAPDFGRARVCRFRIEELIKPARK